jgi:hypothetical protein
VGLGVIAADAAGVPAFTQALFSGERRIRPGPDGAPTGHADEVVLEASGLRFPPRDLEKALPQQTLLLAAAREAVALAGPLPRERTAVLAGMECDAEVARFGARWRAAQWARQLGRGEPTGGWLQQARESLSRALDAPGVVGTMPNIVANRVNSQLDLAGPSLTVSAEEISGLVALDIAARALREGEIDAALVGAVDASAEPVHRQAAAELLPARSQPAGDAAVVLVLKRADDAHRDGLEVLALLGEGGASEDLVFGPGADALDLTPLFGHAHAASGLLHVAAATLACRHQARPPDAPGGQAAPWLAAGEPGTACVAVEALGAAEAELELAVPTLGAPQRLLLRPPPRVFCFCGHDDAEVRERLRGGSESRHGAVRLSIVAAD